MGGTTDIFADLERGESFDLALTITDKVTGAAVDITSSGFRWEVQDAAGSVVLLKTVGVGLIKDSPATTGILFLRLAEVDYGGLALDTKYTHALWWDRAGDDVHVRPIMDGVFRFTERSVITLP